MSQDLITVLSSACIYGLCVPSVILQRPTQVPVTFFTLGKEQLTLKVNLVGSS